MPSFSPVVSATIQGALMSGFSNLLAQALEAWHTGTAFKLNTDTLIAFTVFALLATPPNFLWQQYLEETFPSYVVQPEIVEVRESEKPAHIPPKSPGGGNPKEIVPKSKLKKRNIAIKFSLDQTIGAVINTVAFIAGMGALQGLDNDVIWGMVQRQTIPLMSAGLKLWPLVSLVSFTLIPFEYRLLFGSIVGLGWNIFLSLFTSNS